MSFSVGVIEEKCAWCDKKAEYLMTVGIAYGLLGSARYFVCNTHRLEKSLKEKKKWGI